MSWKRYFTPVEGDAGTRSPLSMGQGQQPGPARSNYSSFLPDVYTGAPNRVERYGQYNTMDQDSEVNAALDILAEFCSQQNPINKTSFSIDFKKIATNSEVKVLEQYLQQWTKMNNFGTRMFRIVRNVFKYGDAFFIRDPETAKWHHVDPAKVSSIIVNESEGKTPEQYIVRDINLNFIDNVATTPFQTNGNATGGGDGYLTGGVRGMVGNTQTSGSSAGRFGHDKTKEIAVDAAHMVHLSLSEGLDNNAPFGNSLLEGIFKVYKQKELLEDAIIIYRTQRAPERRVFYVDVGNMPSHLAMQFVERVKTEIHQRRIPSKTGGGTSVIDSAYNPLSTNEDYFFPQTAEGRGSKVETLPGGTNLGEIDDLKFFTNKLFRGLRIPISYLPTGPDEGATGYNDGRVGTALIQEYRFNEYCKRLQRLVSKTFDREFKMFLRWRGLELDNASFELRLNPPQNFAKFRETEVDNAKIGTFTALEGYPFFSKRFLLERYLGLTEEELAQNSRQWAEENDEPETDTPNMRSVGITPGGIESDLDNFAMPDVPEEGGGEEGVEAPEGEGASAPGGPTGSAQSPIPGTPPPTEVPA